MRKNEQKMLTRLMVLDRSRIDREARTAELAFSSETLVPRWFGMEKLSHAPEAVNLERMNDGAPLLDSHDPTRQIGVVESAQLGEDKRARAVVRFSKSARGEEMWQDVLDGIRTKVSVGYMVDDSKPTGEKLDGVPVHEVTRWTPFEVSLVAIPADNAVGVGRELAIELDTESVSRDADAGQPAEAAEQTQDAPAAEAVEQRVEIQHMDEKKIERQRIADIDTLAAKYASKVADMPALRQAAVDGELSAEAFRASILDNLKPEAPVTPQLKGSAPTMDAKDVRKWSLTRAIAGQLHRVGQGPAVDDGLERETTQEMNRRGYGNRGGIVVPDEVLFRDWTVTDAAGAGNLVGTDYMAGSFVDLLRSKQVASRIGVTRMSGLVGNVAIPRQSGAATAYWVGEGSAATESSGSVNQLSLSPKTVSAFTDISRKLILQSAPAAEGLVRNDLAQVLGIAIDTALFHGLGSSNQPLGLQYSGSIVSASRAAWTRTGSTDLEGNVTNQNYDGQFFYVMRPQLAATLKSRDYGTDTGANIIENGMMNGYPVQTSNIISSGFIFFGDFSQLILAEWGGLEILVDPYTASTAGTIRVVAFHSVDVGIRYAEAFSYAYNVT